MAKPKKLQPIQPDTDLFLTQEQVSQDLGITLSTLATWASQGKGPPFVKLGRFRRYPLADFRHWKATLPRSHKTTPQVRRAA